MNNTKKKERNNEWTERRREETTGKKDGHGMPTGSRNSVDAFEVITLVQIKEKRKIRKDSTLINKTRA